jgi:acyl-coenzyme A thioesterase PaaI-like protein
MTEALFNYGEDPDAPGWMRWELRERGRYNDFLGPLSTRLDGEIARVRMTPNFSHSNLGNNVHGGTMLGFIDVALFGGARTLGILGSQRVVTLDLSTQFIGATRLDVPLEARVELLRETGHLIFLRGLVVQEEAIVASFTGTVRKLGER